MLVATGTDTSGVDPDPATAAIKIAEQAESWKAVVEQHGSLEQMPVSIAEAIASGEPIAKGDDGQLTSSEPGCGTGAAMYPVPVGAATGSPTLANYTAPQSTPPTVTPVEVPNNTPAEVPAPIDETAPRPAANDNKPNIPANENFPPSEEESRPSSAVARWIATLPVTGALALAILAATTGSTSNDDQPFDRNNFLSSDAKPLFGPVMFPFPGSDGRYYRNQQQADWAQDAVQDEDLASTPAPAGGAVVTNPSGGNGGSVVTPPGQTQTATTQPAPVTPNAEPAPAQPAAGEPGSLPPTATPPEPYATPTPTEGLPSEGTTGQPVPVTAPTMQDQPAEDRWPS